MGAGEAWTTHHQARPGELLHGGTILALPPLLPLATSSRGRYLSPCHLLSAQRGVLILLETDESARD